MKKGKALGLLLGLVAMAGWPSFAQRYRYHNEAVVNPWDETGAIPQAHNRFTFARAKYTSYRNGWSWDTDYPDSDVNFSLRLAELTTIDVNRDASGRIIHAIVDLADPMLVHFPFLYMVEVGYSNLTDSEVEGLRNYLLRGGFLLVDDFWEWREWDNWETQVRKLFPDAESYPIVDIPLSHPIFHCVFRLDQVPQVPSINSWVNYRAESDRRGAVASCRGMFDHAGRLMMVMMHNTDLGDGWEREGEDFEYFQKFSVAKAYPMGINIVVYAMTH